MYLLRSSCLHQFIDPAERCAAPDAARKLG